MRKRERQQLIESLIREGGLSTQSDLAAALRDRGAQVTQATVSRDLRELGVQKGAGPDGRGRFVMPAPRMRRSPETALARVLSESEAVWQAAQNLVVIRSQPGTAPALGRGLDEFEHADIIGTVAGDDTVLIITADADRAVQLVNFLSGLAPE